jgi:hypothetical protein
MTYHGWAFGIGCEYFDAKVKTISDWKRSVTSTLEALPSVTDLKIIVDERMLRTREYIYPVAGSMKFTVTIPTRFQAELDPLGLGLPILRTPADMSGRVVAAHSHNAKAQASIEIP